MNVQAKKETKEVLTPITKSQPNEILPTDALFISELQSYGRDSGSLDVPNLPVFKDLYDWLQSQLKKQQDGTINELVKIELENMGFEWQPVKKEPKVEILKNQAEVLEYFRMGINII